MKYLIPLLLAGCSTHWGPPEVQDAFVKSRDQVLYSMRGDDVNTWTGGCPGVGTCVEQSLCAIEHLRVAGYRTAYMSWCSTPDPEYDHVIASVDQWHIDGRVTPSEPCKVTGRCRQIVFSDDKISTAGKWLCSWDDGTFKIYNVKENQNAIKY